MAVRDLVLGVDGSVEDIVRRVVYKCLVAGVRWRCTTCRWCEPTSRIHPLDELGLAQRVAASRSVLVIDHIEEEPGNRILLDESRISGGSGGLVQFGPDGARVLGLPRDANLAIGHHLWIRIRLLRVGAEVVRDKLLKIVVEQGGLRSEEYIRESSIGCGPAHVVLGTVAVTDEEWYKPLSYFN